MPRTVAVASDHGGYALKNHIRDYLAQRGFVCVDFGAEGPESCDYPDYVRPACRAVQRGECECALLFCGTGVGVSLAANKMRGIRACCCSDVYSAGMTRAHNNANALCIGGRVVGFGLAEKLVDAFLSTAFEDGGNHRRRVDKIADIEREESAKSLL